MSGARTMGWRLDQAPKKVQSTELAAMDWRARSLVLGTSPLLRWDGSSYGSLTWELRGKASNGDYTRRFQTGIGQTEQVSIEPFTYWEIELLQLPVSLSASFKVSGWVAVSEGEANSSRPSRVMRAEHYTAGTWAVPGGAVKLFAASNVPSFTWQTQIFDATGAPVTIAIAQALLVGQEFEVRGTHFEINAGADLVWEVHL